MSTDGALQESGLTGPERHHFLSPHYDDIALSCGGTVAILAGTGAKPEIEVVFGAEPDLEQPLSAFATELHRRWGLNADQVIRQRRREEAAAAGLLGATSTSLSWSDAIYRGTSYQDDEQLRGPIADSEAALPAQIAAELASRSPSRASTRFYAPLGVGRHVDHQICFAAALELLADGWEVWFYEDIPYALVRNALEERLTQVNDAWEIMAPAAVCVRRLEPADRINISSVWDKKLAAILAYPSQVPTIFRHLARDYSEASIDAVLRGYAARRVGTLCEQMWRLGSEISEPESR
jgi:LmbE family N-acetylglucosaminyl deacetylase